MLDDEWLKRVEGLTAERYGYDILWPKEMRNKKVMKVKGAIAPLLLVFNLNPDYSGQGEYEPYPRL